MSGSNFGAAVPSIGNARKYWREVFCKATSEINIFWYVYQDYSSNPSFGIFNSAGNAIYDLKSC